MVLLNRQHAPNTALLEQKGTHAVPNLMNNLHVSNPKLILNSCMCIDLNIRIRNTPIDRPGTELVCFDVTLHFTYGDTRIVCMDIRSSDYQNLHRVHPP